MTRDASATRRGFLAATGTALLAGCGGLDQFSEQSSESVRSSRLPDVDDVDEAKPAVVETVPVAIDRSALDDARRRVTELLETLPVPFGPESVPNGHVRQRLVAAAEDATRRVEDARTAQSRLSALRSLREARARARYAAAGWAFAQGDGTESALRAEHRRTVREAESFREEYRYRGTDPVRAALVHARVERNLRYVIDDSPSTVGRSEGALLAVAERGEHAESARAYVADSRHLSDQLAASLPDDAGTVREALTAATDSLADDLRNRRESLPDEPTEGDRESLWRLRYRLHEDANDGVRRVTEAPGPASGVLAATAGLTDFLARDRLRDRIDDGERFRVEAIADVREARSAALEAVRTVLEQSPRPGLARPVLADAAAAVTYADADLARFRGEVRLSRLDDPVREYTTAALRARSVSTACRRVIDALEN